MKRSVTIGFLLMLFTTGAYAQVFKVRENRMWISLPASLPESTAVQFIWKFNLHDIGLYQLLRTGKYDSLKAQGWSVIAEEKKYILSKALGKPEPTPYTAGKVIFTPVPTPDNWREVGGNRTTWGFNRFQNGREFLIENKIVHFELKGYSGAKNVKLAGNFTNWQHAAFPMTRTADGWKVQVKLEPGQYYYKFIIDGHWITDPVNELTENDGRGNMNSVFFVPNEKFRLKNHANARKVYVTGAFSNWMDGAVPMKKVGDSWEAQVYIEEGTYQYHFLVDGKKVKPDNNGEKPLTLGSPYTFRLNGFNNARNVILAGNFNFWNKEDLKMKKTANGWELPYVLGPGNYQYKFIVDGRWITDPANKMIVRDEHGNDNSFFVFGANYTFRLSGYMDAKDVRITGDFTEYSPTGIQMEKTNSGWQARVFLAKGKHRYKYIVDGQSMKDPANNAWEYTRNKDKISVLWIDPNAPN